MYVRKTTDEYRLFVNYGQGWEHEVTEFSWTAIRKREKEYHLNCSFPTKIRKMRIPLERKENV